MVWQSKVYELQQNQWQGQHLKASSETYNKKTQHTEWADTAKVRKQKCSSMNYVQKQNKMSLFHVIIHFFLWLKKQWEFIDLPATLLTTLEASSLIIKTDTLSERVIKVKAAQVANAFALSLPMIWVLLSVYLCEGGIPKTWTAEISTGLRVWTDGDQKMHSFK